MSKTKNGTWYFNHLTAQWTLVPKPVFLGILAASWERATKELQERFHGQS
jgi:hypothetical protein